MFSQIYSYLFDERIDDAENNIGNKFTNFYYLTLIRKDENSPWSIHGLWPQTSINSYPTFCKDVEFDVTKLDPIISKLNEYWYSDEEPNENFWKHEWEKHGSCMYNDCDEFEYFNKAIELYESIIKNDIIINKYLKTKTESMIPYDREFNLISNDNYTQIVSDCGR